MEVLISPAETAKLPKKPNYNFEKNRKEQDRKKKKAEKRVRKLENSRSQREAPAGDLQDGRSAPPTE